VRWGSEAVALIAIVDGARLDVVDMVAIATQARPCKLSAPALPIASLSSTLRRRPAARWMQSLTTGAHRQVGTMIHWLGAPGGMESRPSGCHAAHKCSDASLNQHEPRARAI
jgi:hypothetical protein